MTAPAALTAEDARVVPRPISSGAVAPPVRISVTPVEDFAAVGALWRALEPMAAPSFFQSWTWAGCLAEERFNAPLLLRAEQGGHLVGLGLFNRRDGPFGTASLWLNETGDRRLDSVFVEHNGLLLARGAEALLPACLKALPFTAAGRFRHPMGVRLHLGGVDAAHLAAARQVGSVALTAESVAPYVDLAALASGPDGYLATLSANTRYQLRRSDRCFARLGPLELRQAGTVGEALAFLEAMAALHRAAWAARGRVGAFSDPDFLRFHHALVARGMPRGEIDLLRISAGPLTLGYLYNFRLNGRVLAYQSGFDYPQVEAQAGPHAKAGLTSHHAAILRARAAGALTYDFLAGPYRFKRSLAGHTAGTLYWLDVAPLLSGQGLAIWLRSVGQIPAIDALLRRLGVRPGPRWPQVAPEGAE